MDGQRKCVWCGAILPVGAPRNRTLCSSGCKKAVYNHRNRDRINARQRKRWADGKAQAAAARYKQKVSREKASRRDAKRRASEEGFVWSLAVLERQSCVRCGATFTAAYRHRSYCSNSCRVMAKRNLERKREYDRAYNRRVRALTSVSTLLLPMESS